MKEFKEFHGKTLDDAIGEALAYYGVPREKLEIEIVNDAKTGIFGLVSVKKACIRAARLSLPASLLEDAETPTQNVAEQPKSAKNRSSETQDKPSSRGQKNTNAKNTGGKSEAKPRTAKHEEDTEGSLGSSSEKKISAKSTQGKKTSSKEKKPLGCHDDLAETPSEITLTENVTETTPVAPSEKKRPERKNTPKGSSENTRERGAHRQTERKDSEDAVREQDRSESLPELDLDALDKDYVTALVKEVVYSLVNPIIGEVGCEVSISGNRVRILLESTEDSGILVGRDGQTLASVQYIAGRIISNRLGGALRFHIDAGNYRERQEDKLKSLALSLAEKVKATGKTQSTRPLSAYQRRTVHLALEGDEMIQTSSKGDGAQRRVLIQLKRQRLQKVEALSETEIEISSNETERAPLNTIAGSVSEA